MSDMLTSETLRPLICDLLEWLARRHGKPAFAEAAQKIDAAIDAAIKDPATRTRDLGGTLGTQDFAKNVASRLG